MEIAAEPHSSNIHRVAAWLIFFQLVSTRYERGSIILTSDKSYGGWGSIFGDPIIAMAILDRLPHQATTLSVGKTFRAKVIGWRACQANQRALFTAAMDMLNHLNASQVEAAGLY